jgi:hypothetical protein
MRKPFRTLGMASLRLGTNSTVNFRVCTKRNFRIFVSVPVNIGPCSLSSFASPEHEMKLMNLWKKIVRPVFLTTVNPKIISFRIDVQHVNGNIDACSLGRLKAIGKVM